MCCKMLERMLLPKMGPSTMCLVSSLCLEGEPPRRWFGNWWMSASAVIRPCSKMWDIFVDAACQVAECCGKFVSVHCCADNGKLLFFSAFFLFLDVIVHEPSCFSTGVAVCTKSSGAGTLMLAVRVCLMQREVHARTAQTHALGCWC